MWFKEQPRWKQALITLIALLVVLSLVQALFGKDVKENELVTLDRKVRIASVSSLSNSEGDFPLVGTVTSVSEATIRSEAGGKLVRVYKKLGDQVFAGGVIAEFENAGERAAVLQAEGAYDQAKASRNLATISGTINTLNSGQTGTSLLDTKNQTLNTLSLMPHTGMPNLPPSNY